MKKLLLSFVLPCYNVENYIGECLDSLFQQDISQNEYEVICVNDCSTDSTEDIIREYQNKYSSIRLINHDVNKTAGEARNTGLEHALGKYVWFVDPDDLIEGNVLKRLLSYCESGNLDILMFNHSVFDKKEGITSKIITYSNSQIMTGDDFIRKYFYKKISSVSIVWLEIFNVDFIKLNKIRFPRLFFGEDSIFVWKCFFQSQRIQSISDTIYIYRVNDSSIASVFKRIPNAEQFYSRNILFPYEIYQLQIELVARQYDIDVIDDLENSIKWFLVQFQKDLKTLSKTELKRLFLICKQNKEVYYKLLSYMNWKIKLFHWLFCFR